MKLGHAGQCFPGGTLILPLPNARHSATEGAQAMQINLAAKKNVKNFANRIPRKRKQRFALGPPKLAPAEHCCGASSTTLQLANASYSILEVAQAITTTLKRKNLAS